MFNTARRWLTMTLNRFAAKPRLDEVIISQVISGRLRFAQYVDPKEGETPAMRNSYRTLVKEPTIKSCLDTIVGGVAAGEIDVPPTDKSPRAAEVAELCKALIDNCRDGIIGIVQAIIGNGMIEGYVVAEPKWEVQRHGRWAGKVMLDQVKPKPTDDYWFEVDKFWNVTGIMSRFDPVTVYPTSDFIYWRHQGGYTPNPHGTSLLRSCYRSAWMLDTVWKLRGIGLERYTLPVILAKYPYGNDPVKLAMESAVKRLKATGYGVIPQEAMIEPLQMAQRGTADFEAAVKDLKEDVCIGMVGGSLQTLQGFTPGGRGSSAVHQSVVDNRIWMYANAICEIIYRQIYTPAVHWNYGTDTPVPKPVLGGLNDEEVKKSLDLDEQLQRMGYPVSISGISERVRRSPGVGDDILKPPQAAQQGLGGMGGLFGGMGGDNGPAGPVGGQDGPPAPPTPSAEPSKPPEPPKPAEPAKEFSDGSKGPAVVIINHGGNRDAQTFSGQAFSEYRRFSASDWQGPQQGPRGGTFWQNSRTGTKVYQRENPGGSDDHEATHDQHGNATSAGNPAVTVERGAADAQSSPTASTTGTNTPETTPPARERDRMRPRPEGWGEPVIPGQQVRPDRDGQPTWNQATSTGLPRARPIIEDVQTLFRNPNNITDADVQRVVDAIGNISGRDALYTVAVAMGVEGSMSPAVVAGNVSEVLNPHRPYTPGSSSAPLVPNIVPRAPRASRTAAPADATAPAETATPAAPAAPEPPAPEAPAPRARRTRAARAPAPETPEPEKKKFTKTSKAEVRLPSQTEASLASSMKSIIPEWDTHTQGMTQSEAIMTLVGAPDFIKTNHVRVRASGANVYVEIDGPNNLKMYRTIGVNRDGEPFIHNDLFKAGGNKGDGFGADVFSRQVQAAAAAGFKEIETHAAGDYSSSRNDGYNGYYTWARFGYNYPIAGLYSNTRAMAREKYPNAETVQDILKEPGGANWWKINGSGMGEAKFDLSEGSRSQRILSEYMADQAAKKALRQSVLTSGTPSPGKLTHDGKEYRVVKVDGKIEVRAPGHQEGDRAFAQVKPNSAEHRKLSPHAQDIDAERAAARVEQERVASEARQRARAQDQAREQERLANRAAQNGGRHEADRPTNHDDLTVDRQRLRSMSAAQQTQWKDRINAGFRTGHLRVPAGSAFNVEGNPVTVQSAEMRDGIATAKLKHHDGSTSSVPLSTIIADGYRPSVLKPDDLTASVGRDTAWAYRVSDAMSSGELAPQVGDTTGHGGGTITEINRSGPNGRLRFNVRNPSGTIARDVTPGSLVQSGWRPRA